MASAATRSARATHAALSRHRPADDPAVLDAQVDLKAARLADAVEREVASWPPLPAERRAAIAVLLLGPSSAGGSAA